MLDILAERKQKLFNNCNSIALIALIALQYPTVRGSSMSILKSWGSEEHFSCY